MTRHADLVFFGHRDDPLQEIRNALPGGLFTDRAGFGERRILRRFLIHKSAVVRAAAARRGLRTHYAENGHVVLQGRDAGVRGIANHLADIVDFAVALGTLAQHDIGVLRLGDIGGAERHRDHLEANAERLDAFSQTAERCGRPTLV